MKVILKHMWFSPSLSSRPDRLRTISGRRFKPGTYDVGDGLNQMPRSLVEADPRVLPSSAKIIEDAAAPAPAPAPEPTGFEHRDNDIGRQSAEAVAKKLEEAEENERRQQEAAEAFKRRLAEEEAQKASSGKAGKNK